jgi:hypothetical protein
LHHGLRARKPNAKGQRLRDFAVDGPCPRDYPALASGDVLQGAAADCNSAGETHAWFDSRVAHHSPSESSDAQGGLMRRQRMRWFCLMVVFSRIFNPDAPHTRAIGARRRAIMRLFVVD